MQPTSGRSPLSAAVLASIFLVGCGNAETERDNDVASEGARSEVAAEASEQAGAPTEPASSDAETAGAFEATITGARDISFSGPATFAFGGGEVSLNLRSDDENNVVQIRSSQLFESSPTEGTYHLDQTDQSEPEWDITVVDREPDAGDQAGVYSAREGSVTFASVTAERIEGEFEIMASSPFTQDEIEVSGTFTAICNTITGPGGECF